MAASVKTDRLIARFRSAVRRSARLKPSEWATGRVAIKDGLSPKFDAANTPWLTDALDSLANPECRQLVLLAPVGTGKTAAMGEAAVAYIVAEDPGPTLIVNQTDADLEDWAKNRLAHTLKETPETKSLWPSGRYGTTNTSYLFPHMSMYLTGANMSGLQSKSMRRVICDEPWIWKKGLIDEAKGRLHDRWNRQFILLSQAGVEGEDLDAEWETTDKREFCFECPNCKTRQPWDWSRRIMSEVKDGEKIDLTATAKTCRIRCATEGCDFEIADNPRDRRSLAEGATYVSTAAGEPGHIGYHYNILCNWRKPLWEVALQFLKAKESAKKGDLVPLRQFIQKRLAEPWRDEMAESSTEVVLAGYSRDDIDPTAKVEGERMRFATIDAGGDHFWCVIRAWAQGGASKLLYEGYVPGLGGDEAELVKLLARFQVLPAKTLLDLGYEWDRMVELCAKHGWTGIRGAGEQNSWEHHLQNGSKVEKPYSLIRKTRSSKGAVVKYVFVGTNTLKDMLARLASGNGVEWVTFSDVSKAYKKHFKAESQQEVEVGRRKEIKRVWILKNRKANHLFDCEVYQVGAALMFRLFDE